jgi:hypothetical protein
MTVWLLLQLVPEHTPINVLDVMLKGMSSQNTRL